MDSSKHPDSPTGHEVDTKYVFVCGGGASGIGKGITVSSLALIMQSAGFRVTVMKIDPYLNIDAGTMNPYEHGEVFVLDDGGEVDLDLGNYERFLGVKLTHRHNITTGKIYKSVLKKERKGDFLGRTVQVIPHITNEIIKWIFDVSEIPVDDSGKPPDICFVEVGGTVGDIESSCFLEAIRQLALIVGPQNFCLFFVSYVPVLGTLGEQKSKPTQHGLKELRFAGLFADFIVLRSDDPVTTQVRNKIALFGSLDPKHVLNAQNVDSLYYVPILLEKQGVCKYICHKLKLHSAIPDLRLWERHYQNVVDIRKQEKIIKIAIVGKYIQLSDAYLSLSKALEHAAFHAKVHLKTDFIESSDLEEEELKKHPEKYANNWQRLKEANGILVPGGFGTRGIQGKMLAVEYARVNKIPFFGICLGMQVAVAEYCRNVMGLKDASSTEWLDPEHPDDAKTENPVIINMPEIDQNKLGGTMRCGARTCVIKDQDTLAYKIYGEEKISERHRHRYEVNPKYIEQIEKAGMRFGGVDEKEIRMEMIELKDHPFFYAVQFHPELKSKVLKPSPPFFAFVLASSGLLDNRLQQNNGLLRSEENELMIFKRQLSEMRKDERDKKSKHFEDTLKHEHPNLTSTDTLKETFTAINTKDEVKKRRDSES